MSAAGIRPQAAGVVFRFRPALEQQLTRRVEDENGERAVQTPRRVGGQFFRRAQLAVVFVYEDDLFHRRPQPFPCAPPASINQPEQILTHIERSLSRLPDGETGVAGARVVNERPQRFSRGRATHVGVIPFERFERFIQ